MARCAVLLLAVLAFSPVGRAIRSAAGAARDTSRATELCTEEKLNKPQDSELDPRSICQLVQSGGLTPEAVVADFEKIMKLAPDMFEPCTVEKVIAGCGSPPVFTCEEKLDQVSKEHFERVHKLGLPPVPDEDAYMRMLCYLVDSGTHNSPTLYKPCTREATSPFCESIRAPTPK
eukprot:TRINITY_DN39681_c0_g1_i2.p1 TRINITY_DN39681_c0_g1~~TRINITY_DN39681_c0_g1_i2.p1  ORF type:complete len:175 (+),score=16.62 TRINITY_DN39681_c0_g1_i2:79-603(+)